MDKTVFLICLHWPGLTLQSMLNTLANCAQSYRIWLCCFLGVTLAHTSYVWAALTRFLLSSLQKWATLNTSAFISELSSSRVRKARLDVVVYFSLLILSPHLSMYTHYYFFFNEFCFYLCTNNCLFYDFPYDKCLDDKFIEMLKQNTLENKLNIV